MAQSFKIEDETYLDSSSVAYNGKRLCDILYPVGSIYITSTNTNPSSELGGNWTLIDKNFTSYIKKYTNSDDILQYITILNDAIEVNELVIRRIGNNLNIRVYLTTLVDITDEKIDVAQLNLDKLGATTLHYSQPLSVFGSDDKNAVIIGGVLYDGIIQFVDTIVRERSTALLPAGATTYIHFSTNLNYTAMIDSYCNKFYWRRTS